MAGAPPTLGNGITVSEYLVRFSPPSTATSGQTLALFCCGSRACVSYLC
ncbi:hypothetical protein GQ600_19728 [Phytophthora cactorum]|nr:hypothetical protein GQ600_19728 [Phytophthora cactorum]